MKLLPLIALGLIFIPSVALAQVAEEISLEEQLEVLQELQGQVDEIAAELGDDGMNPGYDVGSAEVRARVTSIVSDEFVDGVRQMIFIAESNGETFEIDTSTSYLDGLRYNIREGDEVYLQIIYADGVLVQVFLVDVVRTGSLFWIILLFATVIVAIGWWRGAASLVGLAITLAVVFLLIIPQILAGADPVLVTVVGSLIILAVNMHLSHGFTKRTLLAFGSTAVGLGLVWLFANLFVSLSRLSGMASEEAILLQYNAESVAGPGGILLAAIILGAVGVLDDIAITQTETVAELREANPKLTRKELFRAAMRVGRHHIASTVNTLVLAYAGVALPLLLLFMHTQGVDALRFVNEEPVAEEIIRTLAGTLALILTVPISTWLATWSNKR